MMKMLCCALPEMEERKPLVIDVTQVLADEAWATFRTSLGFWHRRFVRRSQYQIDIPENYFVFDQVGKPRFESVDPIGGVPGGGDPQTGVAVSGQTCVKDGDESSASLAADNKTPADLVTEHSGEKSVSGEAVGLDTTFANDTAERQTYQFKLTKTRTSRVSVTYQKGFTVAGKANFSLGLPKTAANGSLGLAVERRYEIRESRGQSFEESVSMEATSDIAVAPKSTYVAKVLLEEHPIHAAFRVRIRMSMPQGRAPVYIRRKSDNTVVFVFNIKDLEDVFLPDATASRFPCVERVPDGEGRAVDLLVEGIVRGNVACDHTINLSSDETEEQKTMAKNRRFQE